MKPLLTILGVLALLMGLLWVGQGTGIVAWPASSFMIGASQWILWGAVLAAIGALMIWLGQRRAG